MPVRERFKKIFKRDTFHSEATSSVGNVSHSLEEASIDELEVSYSANTDGSQPPRSRFVELNPDQILNLKVVYEPDTGNSIADIVFVHGLTGNAVKTWYHPTSKIYWPELLKDDLQNARIFTFGYDANVASLGRGSSMNRLADHARNLVGDLHNKRTSKDEKNRHIIFVAHSLGGLVVKRAMQVSKESADTKFHNIERSTIGIAFLGTPHSGSDLAPLAKAVGGVMKFAKIPINIDILSVLRRDSEVLLDIQNWFASWLRMRASAPGDETPVEIICFKEELSLPMIGKVVEDSQAILPGYFSRTIPTNHMDMTKVRNREDAGYERVLSEIIDWMEKRKPQNIEQNEIDQDPFRARMFNHFMSTLLAHSGSYEDGKYVVKKREIGTCEWFTNHEKFHQWIKKESSRLLWISADPGCGKSVLARYLVDDVLPRPGRTVCYFFFKDSDRNEERVASALCALLHQLLQQRQDLLTDSRLTRVIQNTGSFYGSIHHLWKLFVELSTSSDAGEVICVLDALDESFEDDLPLWTTHLQEYVESYQNSKLKFMLTSRPYQRIQRELRELEDRFPHIHLRAESKDVMNEIIQEVDLVIDSRIQRLRRRRRLRSDECQHLRDLIKANPNRTYLWATVMLDVIEHMPEISNGTITSTVQLSHPDIESAYEGMLKKSQDKNKARKALQLVLAAERALTVQQIGVALTIKQSHRTYEELENDLEPITRFKDTLRETSGLLLVIIADEITDEGKKYPIEEVHLLHQTVREFFIRPLRSPHNSMTNPTNLELQSWKHSTTLPEAHRTLAMACFSYLHMVISHKSAPDEYQHESGTSTLHGTFTEYTLMNWSKHIRKSNINKNDSVIRAAASFCSELYMHETETRNLLFSAAKQGRRVWNPTKDRDRTPPLILATYFGLYQLVEYFLSSSEIDVNARESTGRTALHRAVERNDAKLVRLLLQNDSVYVDLADNYGRTPLVHAYDLGYVDLVALICATGRADANIMHPLDSDMPLLLHAVDTQGEIAAASMVEALLQARDLNTNSFGRGSWNIKTPLMHAASRGFLKVAELILGHARTDVSIASDAGDTALSWAERSSDQEDMVQLILAHQN